MDNQIKISVCVITYNQDKYIKDCLAGILSQKGDFLIELVIRDDCSQDATQEIIKEVLFELNDERIKIKILDSGFNIGANKNLLRVLENCTGDFIAICEGDDYWCDEQKLELQLKKAIEFPSVDLFVHPALYHFPDGRLEEKEWVVKEGLYKQSDIFDADWQFAPTSSYFLRREALTRLPEWLGDASIADIYLEIFFGDKGIYSINKYMSVYRYMADNSWTKKMTDNSVDVLEKNIKHSSDFIERLVACIKIYPEIEVSINRKKNLLQFQVLRALVFLNKKNEVKRLLHSMQGQNNFTFKQKVKLYLAKTPFLYKIITRISNGQNGV